MLTLLRPDWMKLFLRDYRILIHRENLQEFKLEVSGKNFTIPDETNFSESLAWLGTEDSLTLMIQEGNADPAFYTSTENKIEEFLREVKREFLYQYGEEIRISLTILKSKNPNVHIYDLNAFSESMKRLSLEQQLTIFHEAFGTHHHLNLYCPELTESYKTNSICLSGSKEKKSAGENLNRVQQLNNLEKVSFFKEYNELRLSPTDFQWQTSSHPALRSIFSRLSLALCVVYLYDITSVQGNEIEFKLNGYKTFQGRCDVRVCTPALEEEYLEIMTWVYNGGNLQDKIGLARNIISLHLIKDGDILLSGKPFNSIQSGYKVYEKENIRQYIEIRNKISDQLLDFNSRANKLVEEFASGFQKSALALVSFYTSAIILNVLSEKNVMSIFTLEATLLSVAFLLCGYIYYRFSMWEVQQQKNRFEQSYFSIKERFCDLLDQEDIKRILNSDKEFRADLKYIEEKIRKYSMIWKSFLGILLGASVGLYLGAEF